MNVVFRVDGSTHIGLGHVVRCLTLAKQFLTAHKVTFLCCELPEKVKAQINDLGIPVVIVSTEAFVGNLQRESTEEALAASVQEEHARACCSHLHETNLHCVDILIVDHYRLSAPFCRAIRSKCNHIVVIDDLANRPHDCDVLIDQNFYDNLMTRYTGLLPDNTRTLLGPKYALLRKSFYAPHTEIRKGDHFIVCFGGSDPSNMTERVVDIIMALKLQSFTADIVVGAGYVHAARLKEKLANQTNMAFYHDTPSLGQLMQRGSFMIGAGGSMHWERAKSSITGLIVCLAQNQVETTRSLHKAECCLYIGNSDDVKDEEISKAIEFALNSPEKMTTIANNARSLVGEGQNPSFVMDEILKTITR